MSIILKGTNINSNNNGITPNEATNIMFSQNSAEIRIIWEIPKDVTINGVLLSKFDHLIIVRKQGGAPLAPTDGAIVYNGSSTSCKDTSVVSGNSYYYRFFVYDSNKNMNNSTNMIFKQIYNKSSSIKNLSWKEINEISESGKASSMFNIGDEIDVNLSEFKYNDNKDADKVYSFSAQTVTLQIWDFNHFDKIDGSGKAGIVFGMKELLFSDVMKAEVTNYDESVAWSMCEFRTNKLPGIEKCLPGDLIKYIIPVYTYTNNGPRGEEQSVIDKLFLPSITEMGDTTSSGENESKCKAFPIFNSDSSRVKRLNGITQYYWTRTCSSYATPAYYLSDTYVCKSYCCISDGGEFRTREQNTSNTGFCLCFNV